MTSNILELFTSIQGEGKHIGEAVAFVRFNGCNLACPWCDTKYSWKEEGKYSTQTAMDFINFNSGWINRVVFTGGEPLLHAEEIMSIVTGIREPVEVTIETNGTILPPQDLIDYMAVYGFWSVSPKLQCNEPDLSWKEVVAYWEEYSNKQFKFVVTDVERDMRELLDMMKAGWMENGIIVQPDGNKEPYGQACMELAEYVVTHELKDVRVLPQFHKICWGNKRGI